MAGGAGVELIATASDDSTVKIWEGGDEGGKIPVATFEIGCPVTSVAWSADGSSVYVGALDNEIHVGNRFLLGGNQLIIARFTTFENKQKFTLF